MLPFVGVQSEQKSRADLGKTFGGPTHWKDDRAPPHWNSKFKQIMNNCMGVFFPHGDHINAFIEILNLFRKFCHDRSLSVDTTSVS